MRDFIRQLWQRQASPRAITLVTIIAAILSCLALAFAFAAPAIICGWTAR